MTTTGTILIIDDEPNLRRSLALILQRAGHTVTTAADAREALQNMQAGAFDLAFLDLKLPDRSGMSLLPELRQLQPDMPILILTAHATLETAIAAVRQGARDYLIKPIDPSRILARVEEVLAEQARPKRRREIEAEVQNLLAELRQMNDYEPSPTEVLTQLPPTDPARWLRRGPFALDLHTRHALLDDLYVPLPPTTFDYLVALVRHAPDPVAYETLVLEAQGYKLPRAEAREMVRWQIHELRKALEPDAQQRRFIFTVRHIGYRLVI